MLYKFVHVFNFISSFMFSEGFFFFCNLDQDIACFQCSVLDPCSNVVK